MSIERETSPAAFATVSAAVGGLAATVVTGAACVGPLVAIVLGIGGFGWLTRYTHLRVPATAVTALLLVVGFYLAYRRTRSCAASPSRALRVSRAALWVATALAVLTNAFEYLIFPHL